MARRLAIGSVQLSDRAPRLVAAGGEADLQALVAAGGADLVELRADLSNDPRPETLPALLARLGAGGRPVILTARAAAEGGRAMDEARRRALARRPPRRGLPPDVRPRRPPDRTVGPTARHRARRAPPPPPPPIKQPSGGARGFRGGGGEPPSERLCAGTPARVGTPARPAQRSGYGGSPPPPYSTSGARRSAFFALSARFAASSFSFARRERRRFWRRMRARSAAAASATPRTRASSLSSRSRRARKRLRACERSRWHLTITPVGRWRSTTQVDTLLTFCPPFPPERTKCSSSSSSRTPSARMRAASACCFSGETGNTLAGLPSARSAGHRRADPDFGAAISPIFSTAHPAFQVAGRAPEMRRLRPCRTPGLPASFSSPSSRSWPG